MAKTVLGIFDDVDEAHAAVEELIGLGFDRSDISLIRTRREKQRDTDPDEPKTSVKPDWGMAAAGAADAAGSAMVIDSEGGMTDGSMTEGESAAAGAGAGAVIGAGAGLITSMMGLFIPGLGPALGIGPVAATILGGAGLGAIAGGLSGALMNAGVPEEEAAQYTEGVRRGGTLVTVTAPDEQRASDAADVLSGHGAYDIEERATQWRQDAAADSTTTER